MSKPSSGVEKTLYIGPVLRDCVAVGPMKCLMVREDPNAPWQNFYSPIEGFTFEPGYTYTIRVRVNDVPTPVPADASSKKYTLIEVVSKTPAPTLVPGATLAGTSSIWSIRLSSIAAMRTLRAKGEAGEKVSFISSIR